MDTLTTAFATYLLLGPLVGLVLMTVEQGSWPYRAGSNGTLACMFIDYSSH
jgi:hypothetical protein